MYLAKKWDKERGEKLRNVAMYEPKVVPRLNYTTPQKATLKL